jgi:hypothetical protein
MHYLIFVGIVLPVQLLLVTFCLVFIRRKTFPREGREGFQLLAKVFLLMLIVNIISLVPGIGLIAVIIWLVGLKRLSGLDVIPTFILSFCLGIVVFVLMLAVAKLLELPFVAAS